MIQKRVIFKRKLRGTLTIIFFSFLLFIGVFIVLFASWVFLKSQTHVLTPLPKQVSLNASGQMMSRIQQECALRKLSCADIVMHADGTATFSVDTDEEVILSLQKNITLQIASLQLTIAHLTIEGKRFHRLDFRFDKPIITY